MFLEEEYFFLTAFFSSVSVLLRIEERVLNPWKKKSKAERDIFKLIDENINVLKVLTCKLRLPNGCVKPAKAIY